MAGAADQSEDGVGTPCCGGCSAHAQGKVRLSCQFTTRLQVRACQHLPEIRVLPVKVVIYVIRVVFSRQGDILGSIRVYAAIF